MAKVIGVVPASAFTRTQTGSGMDIYKLGNSYIKRVFEAGGLPVAVTPVDNWVPDEQLKLFDGYIVQGGAEFYPYHFQIIHDAVVNHKRYLGICLGEQLIYAYFALRKVVEERGYEGDLVKAICDLITSYGADFSVLEKVEGHYSAATTAGNEDAAKHNVNVVPGTILHRLVGREVIRAQSFHHMQVPPTQNLLTINAWSAMGDGVVEGVEYGDHLLGIQSHPEADALLPEIFTFLTEDDQRA